MLTKEEIKSVITDTLGPIHARLEEIEKRGKEAVAGLNEAQINALIAKAGTVQNHFNPARDPNAADKFQGKGLDFVKFVKAYTLGLKENKDPATLAKALKMPDHIVKAASEASYADGGILVPDMIASDFIELLRARVVAMAMGATSLGFKGSMSFNKQTSAGDAGYIGELQAIPVYQPAWGSVQMSAKKFAAIYAASNDLLRNPSAGAEALLREDLLKVMALKEDLTIIRGAGTAYTPRGIRYWVDAANVNAITGSALANVVADLAKMCRLVEESEIALSRPGWLMTTRVKWFLATILDANGNFVFRDEMASGTLFGYPFAVSNQIPKNLGGGGNESEIYFGEFTEVINGEDTPLTVEAFPNGTYDDGTGTLVSGISKDATPIRALKRHDVIMRHTNTFAVLTGVTWGA